MGMEFIESIRIYDRKFLISGGIENVNVSRREKGGRLDL